MSVLLRPLDAGWLWLESPTNLMHGAVLCIFDLPEGAGPHFVADLVARMRSHTCAVAPYNRRLKRSALGRLWPQWETVDRIDPDRHIFHLALPSPAGERELGVLISQLQSTALDKAHPLWSMHVIEGLPDGRFAIFGKMHHAMADGVAALAMVDAWLSDDPDARNLTPLKPLWAATRTRRPKSAAPTPSTDLLAQLASAPRLLSANTRAAYKAMTGVSTRPWNAPRSPLNTPITTHRRVSTQSFELDRFRKLANQTGTTINDVVLTVCSGALRRYLGEIGGLPDRPLITNIPVSVGRPDAKAEGGNAISWAMVSLATDIEDPRERLAVIRSATTHAKEELGQLGADTIDTYTVLAVSPILVEQAVGLGGHIPPMYNVPISNVPGPRQPKYLDGALLREIYALTVLYGGQALNMVVVSHTDRLNFSFTACATALPHVQRLVGHCRAALAELEHAHKTEAPRKRKAL
ncbi:MAG: diacylglycerol O-acyltransferase / wax synthase [Mycobacterium sp.]|nr:diacylglycerol O-acyltransferase / wax synthase [Mycobacterium sp.]